MLRIGQGFDAHRFKEGDKLIIGGVTIPFEKGMEAHSDGDVLIHALCDALLGALALGDIGLCRGVNPCCDLSALASIVTQTDDGAICPVWGLVLRRGHRFRNDWRSVAGNGRSWADSLCAPVADYSYRGDA